MDSSQWVSRYRFGQAFAVPFEAETQAEQPRRLAEILQKIPREVVERFSGVALRPRRPSRAAGFWISGAGRGAMCSSALRWPAPAGS